MKLKEEGVNESSLTKFDLLRHDEDALSSALAYLLAKDRDFYFDFLNGIIGYSQRKSASHFEDVQIDIQKRREEGITDIEILKQTDYHIIIECKIGRNSVTSQRTQYLTIDEEVDDKYIVFLTQELESFELSREEFEDVYVTWLDIFNLIHEHRDNYDRQLFEEFNRFVERGFNMTEFAKEVLVQDIKAKEAKRFEEFNIYRRRESGGKPLYFAPYYTKSADGKTGITRVSRILGVLTLGPEERNSVEERLRLFAEQTEEADSEEDLVENWKNGLNFGESDEKRTYYFLDEPVELPGVAKKNTKKSSEGWIGRQIPPNRTMSFQKLMKHLK